MSINNLTIDFSGDNYPQVKHICQSFNAVDADKLTDFTLDFIYGTTLHRQRRFDWNSHLKNKNIYSSTIHYQGEKIGNIQLVEYKNLKFFNVEYANPLYFHSFMTEYSFLDPYKIISEFKYNDVKCAFELGYNHSARARKDTTHNPHANCGHNQLNNGVFSYSFNAVVNEFGALHYVHIQNLDILEGEVLCGGDQDWYSFKGYALKAADFEDALKS